MGVKRSVESNRQSNRAGQANLWVWKCWYGIRCVDTHERVKQYYEWQQGNMSEMVGLGADREDGEYWTNICVVALTGV